MDEDVDLVTAERAAELLAMHPESFRRCVRERRWGGLTPEPVDVVGSGRGHAARLYRRRDIEQVRGHRETGDET